MGAHEWGSNIGKLLGNVGDASKDVGEYGLDMVESFGKGVIKGVGDTADLVGDVAGGTANFVSGIAGGGKLYEDDEMGWIDRGNARLGKWLDTHEAVDSKLGKDGFGKTLLKGAELVGEFVSPGGVAAKGVKLGKAAMDFRRVAKEAPDVYKKILAAQKEAKAAGNTFTEADAAKMLDDIAPELANRVKTVALNARDEAGDAIAKLDKSPEAVAKHMADPKTQGKIDEVANTMNKNRRAKHLGMDSKEYDGNFGAGNGKTSAVEGINKEKEFLNKGLEGQKARVTSIEQKRFIDGIQKQIDELGDKKELGEMIAKYSPEEIVTWSTKHPKLSKYLTYGGGATLGVAALLARHTPEEVEEKIAAAMEADMQKDPEGMLPDMDPNEDVSSNETPKKRFSIKHDNGNVFEFDSDKERQMVQKQNRKLRQEGLI